jgi:hypothetical protein
MFVPMSPKLFWEIFWAFDTPGHNFWVIGHILAEILKFQKQKNPKIRIFWKFFSTFSGFVFFRLVKKMGMNLKQNKKFSVVETEAPKQFSLNLVNFSCQNFSSQTLRIFDVRKKHKTFNFFHLLKNARKFQKTKN